MTISSSKFNGLQLIQILKLDNPGQAKRLKTWAEQNKSKAGERRLLWHGSQSANFVGILSQGLRVNANGRDITGILGMGIYFSDFAGKSLRYCHCEPGKEVLLALCEVEVGHTMLCCTGRGINATNEMLASNESCAVFAQGQLAPSSWRDAKCVHPSLQGIRIPDLYKKNSIAPNTTWKSSNEYVVCHSAQVHHRYLFHVKAD